MAIVAFVSSHCGVASIRSVPALVPSRHSNACSRSRTKLGQLRRLNNVAVCGADGLVLQALAPLACAALLSGIRKRGRLRCSSILRCNSGDHDGRGAGHHQDIPEGDEPQSDASHTTTSAQRYLLLDTDLGSIRIRLRPDAAPLTVEHVCRLVRDGLYDGCYFYRSDFVLQWGLWLPDESEVKNPYSDIAENETNTGSFVSNKRGTLSVAHGIGANGNSDIFINLEDNEHLDTMSMGFAVWGEVIDASSMAVVNALARAVKKFEKVAICEALVSDEAMVKPRNPIAVILRKSYASFLEDNECRREDLRY